MVFLWNIDFLPEVLQIFQLLADPRHDIWVQSMPLLPEAATVFMVEFYARFNGWC